AVHRFPIDDLYTPLTTVLMSAEAKIDPSTLRRIAEGQRMVPLQEALDTNHVVLVGDPGAGKSTFLRRIAFAMCETLLGKPTNSASQLILRRPCPFPLLIRAASLANFIQQRRSSNAGEDPIESDSPEWLLVYLSATARENQWPFDRDYV